MFDKIQQAKKMFDLKRKMDSVQKRLAQEHAAWESGNIKIVASGDQKIQRITIDGEDKPEIVRVANKALEEAQKLAAKKMQEFGGDLGLGDLFK